MADCSAVCAGIVRSSCGTHLLDHLAADGTGLTGGEIAVVALLEVDANLPWCTPVILKCPFTHVLWCDKGQKVLCASQCEAGATLGCREDTIGVTGRSTGLLQQETPESEGPPVHR